MSFTCLWAGTAVGEERPSGANSLGMRFVLISAGEFLMGSPDDDPSADADERPQHKVRIARPFYLGTFEVTQQQYEAVMGENPSWFSHRGGGRDAVTGSDVRNLPVEMVSWDEAIEFCRRLGELPAERAAGRTYRLPTEAEWEHACRAGTTTRFAWGERLSSSDANIADAEVNGARPRATQAVGASRPNAWGLYDMHGNVWEWCLDRYSADAYTAAATVDPQGPAEGTGRVVRGGDYRFDAHHARSANRDFTRQSRRDWGNGFRVVFAVQ